jgi:hypothetical protein
MQTDRMLYLALKNFRASASMASIATTIAADAALEQYETEMGPLPEWASAHNIAQEPVLYAQLYTLNGRQRGNGMIYHVAGNSFGVITDMGNTSTLNREELLGIYEIGDFILNEEGYEKRKRQRDDYLEPEEPM